MDFGNFRDQELNKLAPETQEILRGNDDLMYKYLHRIKSQEISTGKGGDLLSPEDVSRLAHSQMTSSIVFDTPQEPEPTVPMPPDGSLDIPLVEPEEVPLESEEVPLQAPVLREVQATPIEPPTLLETAAGTGATLVRSGVATVVDTVDFVRYTGAAVLNRVGFFMDETFRKPQLLRMYGPDALESIQEGSAHIRAHFEKLEKQLTPEEREYYVSLGNRLLRADTPVSNVAEAVLPRVALLLGMSWAMPASMAAGSLSQVKSAPSVAKAFLGWTLKAGAAGAITGEAITPQFLGDQFEQWYKDMPGWQRATYRFLEDFSMSVGIDVGLGLSKELKKALVSEFLTPMSHGIRGFLGEYQEAVGNRYMMQQISKRLLEIPDVAKHLGVEPLDSPKILVKRVVSRKAAYGKPIVSSRAALKKRGVIKPEAPIDKPIVPEDVAPLEIPGVKPTASEVSLPFFESKRASAKAMTGDPLLVKYGKNGAIRAANEAEADFLHLNVKRWTTKKGFMPDPELVTEFKQKYPGQWGKLMNKWSRLNKSEFNMGVYDSATRVHNPYKCWGAHLTDDFVREQKATARVNRVLKKSSSGAVHVPESAGEFLENSFYLAKEVLGGPWGSTSALFAADYAQSSIRGEERMSLDLKHYGAWFAAHYGINLLRAYGSSVPKNVLDEIQNITGVGAIEATAAMKGYQKLLKDSGAKVPGFVDNLMKSMLDPKNQEQLLGIANSFMAEGDQLINPKAIRLGAKATVKNLQAMKAKTVPIVGEAFNRNAFSSWLGLRATSSELFQHIYQTIKKLPIKLIDEARGPASYDQMLRGSGITKAGEQVFKEIFGLSGQLGPREQYSVAVTIRTINTYLMKQMKQSTPEILQEATVNSRGKFLRAFSEWQMWNQMINDPTVMVSPRADQLLNGRSIGVLLENIPEEAARASAEVKRFSGGVDVLMNTIRKASPENDIWKILAELEVRPGMDKRMISGWIQGMLSNPELQGNVAIGLSSQAGINTLSQGIANVFHRIAGDEAGVRGSQAYLMGMVEALPKAMSDALAALRGDFVLSDVISESQGIAYRGVFRKNLLDFVSGDPRDLPVVEATLNLMGKALGVTPGGMLKAMDSFAMRLASTANLRKFMVEKAIEMYPRMPLDQAIQAIQRQPDIMKDLYTQSSNMGAAAAFHDPQVALRAFSLGDKKGAVLERAPGLFKSAVDTVSAAHRWAIVKTQFPFVRTAMVAAREGVRNTFLEFLVQGVPKSGRPLSLRIFERELFNKLPEVMQQEVRREGREIAAKSLAGTLVASGILMAMHRMGYVLTPRSGDDPYANLGVPEGAFVNEETGHVMDSRTSDNLNPGLLLMNLMGRSFFGLGESKRFPPEETTGTEAITYFFGEALASASPKRLSEFTTELNRLLSMEPGATTFAQGQLLVMDTMDKLFRSLEPAQARALRQLMNNQAETRGEPRMNLLGETAERPPSFITFNSQITNDRLAQTMASEGLDITGRFAPRIEGHSLRHAPKLLNKYYKATGEYLNKRHGSILREYGRTHPDFQKKYLEGVLRQARNEAERVLHFKLKQFVESRGGPK